LRCTVVLIEGATSVMGEEAEPPSPEVLIEASANIAVKAESVRVITIRCAPCGWVPRREWFTGVLHYSPTCGGVASSAAELTTVLANLAPVRVSWRVLCPYRGGFEGGGVEVGCLAAAHGPARGCRRRGSVQGTVAGVATSCPRALQQRWGCRRSTWRGAAVAGMAAQG
jgi:hypothetical protein